MLADDSHEISYLIFFRKLRKMSQNLSSAAVVIGALRVNYLSASDVRTRDRNFCRVLTVCLLVTKERVTEVFARF